MRSRRALENNVIRVVVAALLSSDLSAEELRAAAKFIDGPSFGHKLYMLLQEVSYTLEPEVQKYVEDTRSEYRELLDGVRAKKMSKTAFVKRAERLGVRLQPMGSIDHTTMEDLVSLFEELATPSAYEQMRLSLAGGDDAFLKGIMRRTK